MKAGLNLFSIRTLIQSERELTETMSTLKNLGYDYVQFSGAEYDAIKLKNAVKNSGVPVVLTHVPHKLIISEPEKLLEEHLSFGCKNIGLGMMPLEYVKSEDEWKARIEELNDAGRKISSAGGKLFYHHHHYEFMRFSSGETALEYMIKNAPEINFTLDSYWLQYGGQNPETYAEKLCGRMDCVHLKDYRVSTSGDGFMGIKPEFAPLGGGSLNFLTIIENWKNAGAKYFLVEQDNACDYKEPLNQVKISIDYLKSL